MLIVEVEEGKLEGVQKKSKLTGDAYYAFLGIPYAKPPVGDLRFKAPVPGDKWDGIRDASIENQECMQPMISSEVVRIVGSEDCLYLNVFTPQPPSDIEDKKAVMVYIHGGGFQIGSGTMDAFGPDYVIGHDVIAVTLNYRLHVLGFLNTGTKSCPGNAGLKDQLLAFKWLKKNIANFGGDPLNITIFGESAGAASVHLHMLSPLSRGLFHRAIIQSGSSFAPWAYTEDSERRVRKFGAKAGYNCQDMEGLVEYLKKLPAETLCKLVYQCNEDIKRESPSRLDADMFIPSVERIKEDAFLPDLPENLIKNAPHIPIIIGYNNQEGVWCLTSQNEGILDLIIANPSIVLKNNFDLKEDERDELMTQINEFYFKNEPWTREEVIKLFTDLYFIKFYEGIDCLIESHVPPYVYLFSYFGTFNSYMIDAIKNQNLKITGAAHADELGYMFSSKNFDIKEATEADKEVIQNLCTMWTDFVKHGWVQEGGAEPRYITIFFATHTRTHFLRRMHLSYRRIPKSAKLCDKSDPMIKDI